MLNPTLAQVSWAAAQRCSRWLQCCTFPRETCGSGCLQDFHRVCWSRASTWGASGFVRLPTWVRRSVAAKDAWQECYRRRPPCPRLGHLLATRRANTGSRGVAGPEPDCRPSQCGRFRWPPAPCAQLRQVTLGLLRIGCSA